MPLYTFECGQHGRRDVLRPMAEAGKPVYCQAEIAVDEDDPCVSWLCGLPMRRVYNAQRIIVRPRGYSLKPGERTSSGGLAYDDFGYELERGDLRDDASGAYTPESRAKREAEITATDVYVPRPMAEIDRDIPERGHQELHEWARAVHSHMAEER